MLRFKQALVESYIGAIALGWIFAQCILHFVGIFSTPVAAWLSRREYSYLTDRPNVPTGISSQDALPEVVRAAALLVIGYLLLRWLYYSQEETVVTPECSTTTADGPV